MLDVAPAEYPGAKFHFPGAKVTILDINPTSGADIIADITSCREIPDNSYELIVCTEVLEHTLAPWQASREIYRLLKPGGIACVTTPCNFMIHVPSPDCWRFTEQGLRELFKYFTIEELQPLETPGRPPFPIQYTLIARKPE